MQDKYPLPLGTYTLYKEIGRGGFATVYLARDETNAREVAVKVLDPKLASDPAFIARFEQEFQIAARLDHPNIVKMLDHGEAEGRYFIAMSLVRGFDLRTRIRDSGAFAVPVALHIAGQIASALDYAHAQGVIHRDIKSANILLDEDGRALLGDFGLMRAVESSAFMTNFSQSQGFIGTAEYFSPEQARGEAATVSSDIYSFAVVVFEMLTGSVPFHADQPLAVIRKHADEPPPNLLDLRTDLPPALANQVLRALTKRPADRPKSASAFVEQMQAALNAEQQLIAAQADKILKGREAAVLLARTRIEEVKRQRDEAERARKFAESQASELDKLAAETETLLQDLNTEEAQARQAALEAEKARRDAEEKMKTAQTRVARAGQSLERFQKGDIAAELLGDETIVELAKGVELALVRVPAGEFAMGAGKNEPGALGHEKPQHIVHLDQYYMGKYPVTVSQFWTFVIATSYQVTVSGDVKQIGNHPITNVNWDDALAFCKWATHITGMAIRLPTEAQWEKASRGTDGRAYPWGNSEPDVYRCNFGTNVQTTTPVGNYSPRGDSPYKCADMAGNVWEWCNDWFDGTYYQHTAPHNPIGPGSGQVRVIRGGSFANKSAETRCAYRAQLTREHPILWSGFGFVRSQPPLTPDALIAEFSQDRIAGLSYR